LVGFYVLCTVVMVSTGRGANKKHIVRTARDTTALQVPDQATGPVNYGGHGAATFITCPLEGESLPFSILYREYRHSADVAEATRF